MRLHRATMALLVLTALALLLPAGCAKKDSVTNPGSGPTASFTAVPLVGDRPLNVDFTNQSSPGSSPITSVFWSFGDGQTSADINAGHLYSVAGSYTVSLTVTTAAGSNTQTKPNYIVVTNQGATPPNAAFTATPTGGNAPLAVQFSSDSSTPGSSPITGWAWTFGDGGSSADRNPSHTYASDGAYTVALTVTSTVGSDTETKTGYIVVSPAPVGPTAQFSGAPTSGQAPLAVTFTDQSSQGSATITSRSWNFGDGTATSSETNPSHTYTAAGSYTVTLTVTTSVGSDSESKTAYITVNPAPAPPTADFTGTPTAGPVPLNVQFTDHSVPGTSPITAWAWTFGDGGTASSANPSHTYASPGSYSVSLTVTTADGQDTKTRTSYIQPCEAPTADFTGVPTTGVAPLPVIFTDLSTGSPTTRSWDFGDGTPTSSAAAVTHTYNTPGTYTVSLTVGNACGTDTNTKVGYITVTDPCPNPIYSLVSATWDTKHDTDNDGYLDRARLRWNADVTVGCARSVFAKIYYRVVGDTTWSLKGQSLCYTITGARTTDLGSFTVQGLPHACYDFRIVLFECNGTTEKAVLEPTADPDLTNQCFEP